ncbi:serpin B3 [Fopius arisanus]|uniref:Serpin B3 n=2 Tax=Fopius arisanus TaxID=64838 RepID=A0A9R1UBJ1_9HYME|nr:PREDICTED: serpin B3-like [Fopius arisanus]
MVLMYFLLLVLRICRLLGPFIPENVYEIGPHELSRRDTFARQFYTTYGVNVEGNFVSSPIGASISLSMLDYGVNENLSSVLGEKLVFSKNGILQKEDTRALVDVLKSPGHSRMSSLIFASKDLQIKTEFRFAMRNIFQTGITKVNYSDPQQAINTINDWWHAQSRGNNHDIISSDDVSNNTILVFANVIEMNSWWATPLPWFDNQVRSSYDKDGCIHDYHMMNVSKKLKHVNFDKVGILFVEMPYKQEDLSLVLIMSKNASDWTNLDRHIRLDTLFNMSTNANVNFHIPRFRITSTIDLIDILGGAAFREGFNKFNRIATDPFKISSIKQKTYIEIDEENTRAMAVTIITNDESKSENQEAPEAPVDLKTDVPFYFAIIKRLNLSKDFVVLFDGHFKKFDW